MATETAQCSAVWPDAQTPLLVLCCRGELKASPRGRPIQLLPSSPDVSHPGPSTHLLITSLKTSDTPVKTWPRCGSHGSLYQHGQGQRVQDATSVPLSPLSTTADATGAGLRRVLTSLPAFRAQRLLLTWRWAPGACAGPPRGASRNAGALGKADRGHTRSLWSRRLLGHGTHSLPLAPKLGSAAVPPQQQPTLPSKCPCSTEGAAW